MVDERVKKGRRKGVGKVKKIVMQESEGEMVGAGGGGRGGAGRDRSVARPGGGG